MLVGTLGAAALIHFSEGFHGAVQGYTELPVRDVASGEAGRISEVRFDVEAEVHKGDVIAILDSTSVDAELETARAEKSVMSASVDAERKRAKLDLDDDLASLRRELSREREAALGANSAAKAMANERSRIQALIAGKQAIVDDLSALSLKEAEALSVVSSKPAVISLLGSQIDSLSERKLGGAVTSDLEAKVELADRQIRALEVRKAALVLRAPSDGKIIEVLKRPGEFVAVGAPVVRMVGNHPRVLACIQEGRPLDLPHGTKALVRRPGAQTPMTGHVSSRSPAVELLPEQCRATPLTPVWGRKIQIELDDSDQLLAGESVQIEFVMSSDTALPPSVTSSPSGDTAAAADTELAVSPIKVPESLSDVTRFEPSGLVREPGRNSYLVVSDDTGLESERTPMLFRMGPDGRVDESPADIQGIKEISDVESVAAKGSTVFVLASQSRSKRGKRPRARTAFLSLAPAGDNFKVTAELHFIDLLANESAEYLSRLGLTRLDDLEIEGMTHKDGALYFGLKAPLDEQGRALIWKLARPEDLFAGKTPPQAGLSLFARVSLRVGSGEHTVRGGVAELAFIGSDLAIASTPSTDDLATGAVFKIPATGGEPQATLVAAFRKRKPEGLSVALNDPKKLVVVFDNGSSVGEMAELEWP